MDEDENEEDEEDDNKTDDDDVDEEEEYDDDDDDDDESDEDDQKIRPWDVMMNMTSENMQDRFNETVSKNLEENPGTDIQEAEKRAYHDLKPKYLSDFISRYKYLTELSTASQQKNSKYG